VGQISEALIIGAGRIGTSLFRAIKEKTILQVYIADIKPLEGLLAEQIQPREYLQIGSEQQITLPGLIFIAVPDDNITEAAAWLTGFDLHDVIVIHTSGAISADILFPLKKHAARVGSFHPLQTFSGLFCPTTVWQGIYCTYQGDEEGHVVIHKLAGLFGSELVQVTAQQKTAIHSACVLVSNLYFALLTGAEQILDSARLTSSAKKMLMPLITQTIENYHNNSINEALTGPLKRGDIQTIRNHLEYLTGHREIQKIYLNLSKALLNDPNILTKHKTELMELLNDFE